MVAKFGREDRFKLPIAKANAEVKVRDRSATDVAGSDISDETAQCARTSTEDHRKETRETRI